MVTTVIENDVPGDVRQAHNVGGAEGGVAVRLLLSVEGLLKVTAQLSNRSPRLSLHPSLPSPNPQ